MFGAWSLTTNRGRIGNKVTKAAYGLGNILYVFLRLPLVFVLIADVLLAGGLAYVARTHSPFAAVPPPFGSGCPAVPALSGPIVLCAASCATR